MTPLIAHHADTLARALDDLLDLYDPDADDPDAGVRRARDALAAFEAWRKEDLQLALPLQGDADSPQEASAPYGVARTVADLCHLLSALPARAPVFTADSAPPQLRVYASETETAPGTNLLVEVG